MNRSAFIPILLVVAFLLATVPVLAQSAILDPLAPQEQIVLGAPNWNFGPDVTPDISLDHRRMVVSEGCDVNGDGYDDILVGRRDFTHSTTTHAGRAWLFLGGPNGLSATPSLTFTPPVLNTYGFFGTMVACVGDINGDGFEDFAIGMDNYDGTYSDEGAVFVYHGSSTGPSTTYSWMARGDNTWAHFGESIDSAGDINGDGYDDIIVNAYNKYSFEGRDAYVWFGSSTGLGNNGTPANADWYASSPYAAEGGTTTAVRGIGDVNGDGYDDVLVGSLRYDGALTDQGAVYVWHGSGGGLGDPGIPANADWTALGGQASAYFGFGGDGIGDVNGDGYDDLAVGAYGYDNPEASEGKVFVWHGSASGLGPNGTPANADWTAETDTTSALLGFVVRSAGDVNHDGFADLLATAYNFPVPDNGGTLAGAGAWFVWLGSSIGLGDLGTPANADIAQYCNQASAFSGRDEAGAGDVNGDGFSDTLVVAYRYDDPEIDEGVASGWYSPYSANVVFLPAVFRYESP